MRKSIVLSISITFCTLLVIYFGMSIYFINHFYFGSEINSINVSGKTVKEVNELMSSELQGYTLTLKERGEKTEEIKATEIGLKYSPEEQIQNFKDKQNAFKWISASFTAEDNKLTVGISYSEKLLNERVDKLLCLDTRNVTEPKNASFQYKDNSYAVIDEVKGNKINKETLYKQVANAVFKKETLLDLETINCYVNPKYTSKSSKIIEVKDILNKYVSSKITYTFGENKETIDGSIISKCLNVDENYSVIFDEEKLKSYIDKLLSNYNTIKRTRNFVTSSGRAAIIDTGDYGWLIDTDKEAQDIISYIKEGKTISKEPAYRQTALFKGINDIGNTYVEIDLTKQHLWFYKNGSLISQGDVVTGNLSTGHRTPEGIYRLKYKQKGAVLRGADYAAPVDYWMPFNGGIGIHDASWRSEFGGSIYKDNGSHGCINSPYYLAKAIFDNIEEGTPIICYY